MKYLLKLTSLRIALIIAASLAASTTSSRAQGATATISGVQNGAVYNYTITLKDTGATVLNSFWYGWTTGGNNLFSTPTSPASSLGWGSSVSGASIRWVNSTGTALASGLSGTFTFASTATPAQITTSPSGQSVAYVNGIDNTQNSPDSSTPVFSPTLVTVPEPSTLGLLASGIFVLAGLFRRSASRA
jgi:PEP-CTERM motif